MPAYRIRNGIRASSGVAALALSLAAAVSPLGAQQLRGRVVDSSGVGISQAEVVILPDSLHATTGDSGSFSIGGLANGKHTIRVRRLGFEPAFVSILTPATGPLVVVMRPAPVTLQTIVTNALSARLLRVVQREEEHLGVQLYGPRLDSLLHREEGVTVENLLPWDRAVALKLMSSARCPKAVYVDGKLTSAPIRYYISKSEIAAIEVFNSPAFVHEPFLGGGGIGCVQLILIWSKYYQQRPWGGD